MAYEPKPGDGVLFQNRNRSSDKAPNATGTIVAHRDIKAGETLSLAAWTKEGKNGNRFQSLRMSDMKGKQEEKRQEPAGDDFSDPIPF